MGSPGKGTGRGREGNVRPGSPASRRRAGGSGREFRLDVRGRVPVVSGGRGRPGAGGGAPTSRAGTPLVRRRRRAREPAWGGMDAGGVADALLSGACVLFTLGMFSTGL